jgi:oligopeptide transport system substrate-binding protein
MNLVNRINFIFLLLFFLGCSQDQAGDMIEQIQVGGASGTELAEEQILRIGNGSEPGSLDPHLSEGVESSVIGRDLFEGLINELPNGELIPGAATSWDISDDGLIYTFYLREDARWSNGDLITSQDWVYSLRRSVDPATMSSYTFILYPILNTRQIAAGELPPESLGVRAVDEYTIEIILEGPTPYFLGLLTHSQSYPVHQPSVEAFGGEHTRPGNLVSNGAFMLDEWVVQSHVKAVRNPFYWDNASTVINEVWYYPTEDKSGELARYRADELDITQSVPAAQIDWIRENLPNDFLSVPYLGVYYFGFNLLREPFIDNFELRKALTLAINRNIITDQVLNGGQIPAYGWVPPVIGYEQQSMVEATWTQEQREAEARRLYEAAGYSMDNPLEVEIMYNTSQDHRRVAVAIAAMWRQVLGVETTLLNQEWKVFLDTRRAKEVTEVFRGGWIGDYNDANTFAELLQCGSGLNDQGYCNERYDELIQLAAIEDDLEARAQLLQEAELIMIEELPLMPIYFYVSNYLVKPWVGGYETNIMKHDRSKNFYILSH